GYVIRRILRRAVRYYYSYLQSGDALLYRLVPILSEQFENVFPELSKQKDFVAKVVREEEESFLKTLEKGLRKIDEVIRQSKDEAIINGQVAFELYDTFGFPIDLTRLIAGENDFTVDEVGFAEEMQKQKDRSRVATAIDAGDWVGLREGRESHFVGYNDLLIETEVTRDRKIKVKNKTNYQIVLSATPFYAESGGQVGDKGVLVFGEETISVTDTKKENDLIVHLVDKLPAKLDSKVVAHVGMQERLNTSYNHTATHLLHAALKEVLGDHVAQKGSFVSSEVLRFDFSHFSKVTEGELREINRIVNEKIRQNIVVKTEEMSKENALRLGATALFGEKYGNTVRVVTIDPAFSVELCGGTHVPQTGMIGAFTIVSESAVASGVRRIEALTGPSALNYFSDKISQSRQIVELLKGANPLKAIEDMINENHQLKKEVEKAILDKVKHLKLELITGVENIEDVNFIGRKVDLDTADSVKKLAFSLKDSVDRLFLVLAADIQGKPHLSVMICDDLVKEKGYNASTIIRDLAKEINGGGGGQPFFASAGGKDVTGLQKAIDKGRTFISG